MHEDYQAEDDATRPDSQAGLKSFPLSWLAEVTGVSPDFSAMRDALELADEVPLGYVDLYNSAVRAAACARLAARRDTVARGGSFAAEAWLGDRTVKDQLAADLEPEARRLAIINNLSNFFESDGALPWRDYQRETILETLRFLTKGKNEIIRIPALGNDALQRFGYNDQPTGSGKTVAMALTALGMGIGKPVSERYANKLRGAVCGPTLNTLSQTMGDYVRGFSKFAPSIAMARLDHLHRQLPKEWSMMVATYRKLLFMLRDGELQSLGLDLLFLDEGHHALGYNFRKAVMASGIPLIVGFTATPNYNERRQLSHMLPNLIKKVDQIELIERGDLSGLHILELGTGEEFEVSGYTRDGGFLEEDLEVLSYNQARNRKIRDIAAGLVRAGVPTAISLLRGNDCHHARYMADELSKLTVTIGGVTRPIVAKAIGDFKVDGKKMTDEEKEQLLSDFENCKIDVLTYVDYLDESWDSTRLCALIITDPTTSERKQRQRVGRLGRVRAGQPVKWVIELVDGTISANQILAVDLFDTAAGGPELVIGAPEAKHYVNQNRSRFGSERERSARAKDASALDGLFPLLPEDVEQQLDLARVALIEQRQIVAVQEAEMPPAGWPSLAALRQLRPEMSEKLAIGALRSRPDLYEQRTRARSLKGNNQAWEIYYPPEAVAFMKEYVLAEVADRGEEVPIFVATKTLGYHYRRIRQAVSVLVETGAMQPLVSKRSSVSGKLVPHIPTADLPLIRQQIEKGEASYSFVSVQALAALLGRTTNTLKSQANNDGYKVVPGLMNADGSKGDYLLDADLAAFVAGNPRVPDIPNADYKTERETAALLAIDRHALRAMAAECGMRLAKYVLQGPKDSFMATCYSPQQIRILAAERRKRAGAGSVDARLAARQPSEQTSPLPQISPREMVEQALDTILRNKDAKKSLPSLIAHFTPRQGDEAPRLDGRTQDMLHALSALYKEYKRKLRLSRQPDASDPMGQLAFTLLLGSRENGRPPRDFTATLSHLQRQETAASSSVQVSEDEMLMSIAIELKKLIAALTAPGAD